MADGGSARRTKDRMDDRFGQTPRIRDRGDGLNGFWEQARPAQARPGHTFQNHYQVSISEVFFLNSWSGGSAGAGLLKRSGGQRQ